MIYFKVYTSIKKSKSLNRFAEILKIDNATALGYLMMSYFWYAENSYGGHFEENKVNYLVNAANWEGSAEEFMDALIEAGFISCVCTKTVEKDRKQYHFCCNYGEFYEASSDALDLEIAKEFMDKYERKA